jgi:hypothetical protein
MERLSAHIAIGGDIKNTVVREDLTWPEVVLMRDIHGEAAVTNVEVLGESEFDPRDEVERLRTRYGRKFVRVFGRSADRIPLVAPSSIPRFDDEVEIVVRKRRPDLAGNPAFVESEQMRKERAAFQMGGPKPAEPEEELPPMTAEEEAFLEGMTGDDSVTHRKGRARKHAEA